jgi:cytochrome c6
MLRTWACQITTGPKKTYFWAVASAFKRRTMRRLFSLLALCLALVLGAAPSFAADSAHGAQVFSANCAACHMGGGNVVNAERTLKADALKAYLANYADGPEAAVAYQVTNGKNAMPAFGGKLSAGDIEDVASYVIEQSNKGW